MSFSFTFSMSLARSLFFRKSGTMKPPCLLPITGGRSTGGSDDAGFDSAFSSCIYYFFFFSSLLRRFNSASFLSSSWDIAGLPMISVSSWGDLVTMGSSWGCITGASFFSSTTGTGSGFGISFGGSYTWGGGYLAASSAFDISIACLIISASSSSCCFYLCSI